jgi:DNA-binding NarL/FixJ family response regulator
MNGRELADRLTALHPDLKVLFASGYTDDDIVRRGLVDAHLQFIAKPYSIEGLAAKVRLVLDRHA